MHTRRLLWQIYPSHLLVTLVCLAGLTWYASAALRQFAIQRSGDDLTARALLAAEQFRPMLAARDFAAVDARCKQLGPQAATRLTVILPDGKVVGDSSEPPDRMDNHGDRPEVIAALGGAPGTSLRESYTFKETLCYAAVPVRDGGRTLGVVRATVSLAAIDHALSGIRWHLAVGSLLAAALLALVSLLLSRRVTRPLEQLQEGAERFARGDLAHRLAVADSLEIGALAETLNRMAAELDANLRAVVRQRNEREAVLSSMVEGVLAVDAGERLIRLNQAAARLLGTEPGRAEGRMLLEIVRNTELQRLVAAVLATHEPVEGEIVLRNDPERFLYVHCTVLREAREGEIGALAVLHDVTELKKLEQVRRDFVANVSHELRTPITSIKGYVETLLDGAMYQPAELDRFLRIVAAQTDRLNAIFNDVLTLARVEQEAERGQIALAAGAVRGVLEAAIQDCEIKAAAKHLRLELACDEDLQAAMDPPLLEQALVNLLDNAIKYSPEEAAIRIEAVRGPGEIVIRVVDRGCGISREHLPRIFERFYLVDKARSRQLGGTGLGLAIVKHIVQSHRGRVTVESAVGQGSTFAIHLPI
ncbi:MAG: ATP-binding protein [Thermoguttaceae bacterium]|jgi:two-component system phosphate regulon sensor histidine kinase PhoR